MSDSRGLIKISGWEGSEASMDVVFVHGLGGDPRGTWHHQHAINDDNFWPVWLGKEQLCLNIWSFGYDAKATKWQSNGSMPLFDQASNLLDWLNSCDLGKRPLVFITHSMGGLLVKKMLSSANNFDNYKGIIEQTKGIVFLATPHTGAHLANLIDNIGVFARTTVSVEELKAHDSQLRELNEWYRENVRSLEIATKVYYETQPVKGILVVDEDSANPGIEGVKPVAIPKHHIDLCKPDSQNSLVYLGVKKFIEECLKKKQITLNSPTNISINSGTPYFVGRDTQLEQLHEELQKTDRLAICAIAGMGGIGKTELALQYALRYQDNYPGGRCWFPVRGLDLGIQVVSFGRTELGLTIPDELDFNEQVRYCWRNWPEGTALIVLDDVASFSNDYKQRIKPYLPPAESRFKVLVTSRQRPGASYRRIDLDVLSPEAALELLGKLVGKERIEKELTEAEALCEWLGYLPLGLELVGRYLDLHPTLTIAKVQKRLEKKKLAAKALLDPTEEGEMTAQLGVAAAFELSWEDLKDCPEVQQLGCRLSLFAPAPFEWSLVEKCVIETEDDREEEQEELEELRDRVAWPTANRSLLKLNLLQLTEQQTYQLHPLIREFFLTKLAQLPEADSYKQSFCKTMVAVAKTIPQTPTQDQIAVVTPAIPHLDEVATVLTDWLRDEDLILPFVGLGIFYQGRGTYDQAEPWYEKCLDITKSRMGEDHPDVATSRGYLALLYQVQGRYHEAEPLFVQALDMTKQLLGEKHPHVASSLNNLALLYQVQGRYHEAEPLFVQALDMTKQLLGEKHPHVASSLNNLALLYQVQGRYHEAEPLFVQALDMTKQLLGHDHPDVVSSLNNLADLYKAQGRYHEAEPLFVQALDMTKQLLGHDHPHVASILNNLADLYQAQGRYHEAEPLYVQALDMRKQLLGQEHPDVASSLNNLALLYQVQGRYDEAEPLYVQALDMRKQLLGQEHPDVASSLNNLGLLYYAQGRYHEAEPLYVQALDIAERKLGSNHPNTVTYRNNLERLRDDLSQRSVYIALIGLVRYKFLGFRKQRRRKRQDGRGKK
ncbi:FxSxx-COOH system tetratricopeptide repeat protein [Moorena sp. SIO3B2]|uniref:FxSxx-COOH system tetratricopeptide repeat protein n=1 Tax=Moorena sp. SIO3B2 TaxID=2607827 RepID=UPI00257C6A27|nr:FxSxx-COOH system tetratricopeptide repeat protein [Moorena sp. SIO3B2]